LKSSHELIHQPPLGAEEPEPLWVWDVFCHVIDNHGDLGVCWRLSQSLAKRGFQVRLFLDRHEDLDWLAPHWAQPHGFAPTLNGVSVHPWPGETFEDPGLLEPSRLKGAKALHLVVVETFGCELPKAYLAQLARQFERIENGLDRQETAQPQHQLQTTSPPVPSRLAWINLEYLSAESFYQRIHRLPSPQLQGPAKGLTKWFYQPGFTPSSGGLMRAHTVDSPTPETSRSDTPLKATCPIERWVLFCYEPKALMDLMLHLSQSGLPRLLQVTAGRATRHAQECIRCLWPDAGVQWEGGDSDGDDDPAHGFWIKGSNEWIQAPDPQGLSNPGYDRDTVKGFVSGNLRIEFLPYLNQLEFDQLLTKSSLNFVRGEDSLVQALWTGKPFIWQIYPQDDGAHVDKLEAFLATLQAPVSLLHFTRVWNGLGDEKLPPLSPTVLEEWLAWSGEYAKRMQNVPDLTHELVVFAKQLLSPPQPST
jgi:uncharacterized repeat protein (TIGR03837 family)